MNILMVTHYFDSHGGGIELVARRMFEGLGNPGCHIMWAAADVSAPPEKGNCCSSLPLRTWNGIESLTGVPLPVPTPGALKKLHAAVCNADVLILHDCLYISNIAAYLFARMRGIPVIVIQHIGLVPYRNPILRGIMALANRIIARPMLASASQVVFISENTRDYFRSVRFSKPAETIFNGVNCETFRPLRESEPKAEVRAQFGLPADATVALFVGRFVPKKGLNILREMATREPGIIWAFAGSGQLDPAGWGLDNVRVYSNLRNHGLADLYRACDILVLPSTGEGFPLVLQEALASGLPVVCGDHAAAADPILNAYLRGIAVVAGDDQLSASRFLAAVREVLSPSHDTRAAQRRYEFARSRYSWQVALRRYREIAAALADTATQPAAAARKARSAFAAAGESPRGGA